MAFHCIMFSRVPYLHACKTNTRIRPTPKFPQGFWRKTYFCCQVTETAIFVTWWCPLRRESGCVPTRKSGNTGNCQGVFTPVNTSQENCAFLSPRNSERHVWSHTDAENPTYELAQILVHKLESLGNCNG